MDQSLPDFYQHTRRPEWGLAVLAWERDGKRAYLFEGGMLKVLAEPFFELMQPTTEPVENGESIVQRLAKHLEANDTTRPGARAPLPHNVSLQDQLGLMKGEYEGNFTGSEWQEKVRGLGQQRRLKRHRNAAIEHARQELAQAKLDELIQEKRYADVWNQLVEVLAATDLAPPKQVEALRKRTDRATQQSCELLSTLLYGDVSFAECFDSFIKELRRILGSMPSWELCTGALTLVHPEVHVCVRKTSFQKQAELRFTPVPNIQRPNSAGYMACLEMSGAIQEELKQAGAKAEDLLDIHDFVKLTTTPSSLRRMQAVQRAVSRAGANDGSVADA